MMLRLTDRAAEVLAETRSRSGLSDEVGVRISSGSNNGEAPAYRLTFAPGPAPEDLVIQTEVAAVFMAADVAEELQAAVLDAEDGDDGAKLILRRNV